MAIHLLLIYSTFSAPTLLVALVLKGLNLKSWLK